MSDAPKFSDVPLVAVSLGFYGGSMVPVGAKFNFTGNKLPKWAQKQAEAVVTLAKAEAKAKASAADTKPAAAQAAVKTKASATG